MIKRNNNSKNSKKMSRINKLIMQKRNNNFLMPKNNTLKIKKEDKFIIKIHSLFLNSFKNN